VESYLELARRHKFDVLLTISNQLVAAPGEHPVKVPGTKAQLSRWHHVSWSQIRTEALMEQANRSVSDPDQAWILAEFIRYLEHPRSGALDFDDMGPSWVHVRERARTATLHPQDKGVADVTGRFGRLVSFAAMRLSRELGVPVRPVLAKSMPGSYQAGHCRRQRRRTLIPRHTRARTAPSWSSAAQPADRRTSSGHTLTEVARRAQVRGCFAQRR
jgi:hypothetical protein